MPSKHVTNNANSKTKPVYLNAPYKTTKQTIPAKKRSISSDNLITTSNVKPKPIEPIQAHASPAIEVAHKISHSNSNDQIVSKPSIKKFNTVRFFIYLFKEKLD